MSEYFLNYKGEKIFVILIGNRGNKLYFYYPKGDTLVIVDDKGNVVMKEILEVVGEAPAGFRVTELKEDWEKVKNRKVVWNILGKEVESDNIYAVISEVKEYEELKALAYPNRLKSYVFRDENPWDYKDWCCVLISSEKDMEDLPPSFKKVYVKNGEVVV